MTSQVADSESMEQAMVAGGSTGLIVGAVLCALSLLWALMVASGAAQSLVDMIVRWHVIHPVYVIATVEPRRVVALFLLGRYDRLRLRRDLRPSLESRTALPSSIGRFLPGASTPRFTCACSFYRSIDTGDRSI